jgi:hypothetical protein
LSSSIVAQCAPDVQRDMKFRVRLGIEMCRNSSSIICLIDRQTSTTDLFPHVYFVRRRARISNEFSFVFEDGASLTVASN